MACNIETMMLGLHFVSQVIVCKNHELNLHDICNL